jgi:hypothetical protein
LLLHQWLSIGHDRRELRQSPATATHLARQIYNHW